MIPLILTALVATAGPTAPSVPAGSYTYKQAVNGASIGSSTVVVKQTATGTELDEQGTGSMNGMDVSAKATMTLSGDLTPFGYTADYAMAGQDATSSVTFANGSAAVASLNGPLTFPLAGARHFAVLDGALFAGFVALPAQMRAWSDTPVQAVAPMFGQAAAVSVDMTAKPVRPATVPATDTALSLTGQYTGTLWYDPTTFTTDELDVPSQGLVVTRVR